MIVKKIIHEFCDVSRTVKSESQAVELSKSLKKDSGNFSLEVLS